MTEETEWDIIVIGGGLAGLTSGAYLAMAGKSVLLLEQQDFMGGCCGSYSTGGHHVPAATHMVHDPGLINGILVELGAEEVTFTPPDPVFEVTGPCPGKTLIITQDQEIFERSAKGLVTDAARENVSQGLHRLIELSRQIYYETKSLPLESPELMSFFKRLFLGISMQRKLPMSMQYGRMPVQQFLSSIFPGVEMQCLRSAIRSAVPLRGARALDLLQLLGNVVEGNVFYPDKGVESLIYSLNACFRSHGGVIRTGAKVTSVNVAGGQVTGVTLADESTIRGDNVLSTIDMKELFFALLPDKGAPGLFREKLAKIPLSDSYFTVNFSTTRSPGTTSERRKGVLVVNPAVEEDALFTSDEADLVSLFIHFPKPELDRMQDGRSLVQIMAPVRFMHEDNWHSGPQCEKTGEYIEFKNQYADTLIKRADVVVPGLSSQIMDIAVATPVSYRSCTGNDEGAAYGWRRPRMWRQKVPYTHGLYLAGHWTYPGPGVLKTMMSGKNASRIILSGT
ncbi:MAG: NAD(P)/FAD-dependent oxidoreductase [Methanomicrobiales archaeon]|nr:NAD(P)/FAD-dependent oxidoreductase [Methanomicrobiales archaeon]